MEEENDSYPEIVSAQLQPLKFLGPDVFKLAKSNFKRKIFFPVLLHFF